MRLQRMFANPNRPAAAKRAAFTGNWVWLGGMKGYPEGAFASTSPGLECAARKERLMGCTSEPHSISRVEKFPKPTPAERWRK